MWRATVKGLIAHKFRLALTALSVVLGVAFVAGTYVLTDTISHTFDRLFDEVSAGIDVYVRTEAAFVDQRGGGRERIPETLLPAVLGVEGVRLAEGVVSGYAQLVDKQGEAIAPMGPPTLGVSWGEHGELSSLSIRQGRGPERPGEVAVDAGTAQRHRFRVGDRARVLFQGPSEEFTIVGVAGFGEAGNLAGATLAAFDLRTAQRVLGAEGTFDAIVVAGDEGIPAARLRDRIAALLPEGVEATTGEAVVAEQVESVRQALGFFNTALLVFAGISLFVGAFIIFNTFNILVTQRTRELALLRAIGATARQVVRSVVAEALIVGAVASAAGLGLGVLVAMGLQGLLRGFGMDLPSSTLQVEARTVAVSIAVGVAVTFGASLFPARRAARVPPLAAMRDVETVRSVSMRRRSLAGVLVTGVGMGTLAAGLFGGVGNALELVGLGVAATFLGVATLSPLVARPLARAIGSPLPRLAAMPGKLGRENAMRNPRRTASTSSALMIGLAMVGTFLILGQSLKVSAGKAIEESLRADYVLGAGPRFGSFSPTVAAELAQRPEIAIVSQFRIGQWRKPGSTGLKFLTAVDPGTVDQVLELKVGRGSAAALGEDGVLLHALVAEEEGVGVGDAFPMEFPSAGVVPLRVAGIFEENLTTGDHVISLATHERLYTERLDQTVMVQTASGFTLAQSRRAVEEVVEAFPNVTVQDQGEVREAQERQINQLLGLVSALLGLAILIALLGIVNTLALSVLERTRELGLLRAVGMSRHQVRAMIRWESVIIALLGGVLGLAVGVFFGWALVAALADEGVTELAVPAGQLTVFLALAGLAGVLAAVLPARRAANMDVLRAVTVE